MKGGQEKATIKRGWEGVVGMILLLLHFKKTERRGGERSKAWGKKTGSQREKNEDEGEGGGGLFLKLSLGEATKEVGERRLIGNTHLRYLLQEKKRVGVIKGGGGQCI